MLIIYLYISVFMYLMGLMVFCLKRKHLLLMLLSLEFVVLSLYLSLFIYLMNFSNEVYFSMVFLTMSVCEGALGLSILISLMRVHGNDYFHTFSMLW